MSQAKRPRANPHSQRGVGMIDALVAMLVFSLGLLGLAALYEQSAPAPLQNQATTSVQMAGGSLLAQLWADPSVLPVNVTNVTTASGMPTSLQGWFAQAQSALPGLSVSIASGNDASGNPCSSTSCGIALTLAWKQLGSTRSQIFQGQVGIH
ncbi:MAG: hypothetical protein HIU89_16380 [Proteobacteria bacterium]|nr:hypothetical protein [Pseudomonadota bacterium]